MKPIADVASLCRALGDPTRLRILGLLLAGEVCVCHIHESLKIPQPKASRHLAHLRRAGLVGTRRDRLWMHYRLVPLSASARRVILEAVVHALAQMEAVQRDAQRLRKRTRRRLPSSPPKFQRSTADLSPDFR